MSNNVTIEGSYELLRKSESILNAIKDQVTRLPDSMAAKSAMLVTERHLAESLRVASIGISAIEKVTENNILTVYDYHTNLSAVYSEVVTFQSNIQPYFQ